MNKTALITGSKQGIGKAIALAFAKAGYDVAVNCRNEDGVPAALEVVKQCRKTGVDADCFAADVSDFAQCGELVKKVASRFGSVDVLVNNAGITKDGLIARMSEEQYDSVIAANQKSVFNMTRHVSGIMIKQKGGRIINITSVSGLYGNAGQFNYSASKAAIIGMTYTAAKELGGRGITVNAIAPGFIETDMTGKLSEKIKESIVASTSLKRMGQPQEVADLAVFLASEAAGYITGQVICVDGGLMM